MWFVVLSWWVVVRERGENIFNLWEKERANSSKKKEKKTKTTKKMFEA